MKIEISRGGFLGLFPMTIVFEGTADDWRILRSKVTTEDELISAILARL